MAASIRIMKTFKRLPSLFSSHVSSNKILRLELRRKGKSRSGHRSFPPTPDPGFCQSAYVRQFETNEFIDPNDPMYARWKNKPHPETPTNYSLDRLLPEPVKGKAFERLPLRLTLEANTTYKFCTCGYSKQQPFCDASHKSPHHMSTRPHHVKYRPISFTVEETKEYWLCMCKQSDNRPFCDGSHKQIEDPAPPPKDK